LIGKIGVETLLNGSSRQSQRAMAQGHFQGFEVQLRDSLGT
jgi:hypothetical protein